jgi:hypothetical protein
MQPESGLNESYDLSQLGFQFQDGERVRVWMVRRGADVDDWLERA